MEQITLSIAIATLFLFGYLMFFFKTKNEKLLSAIPGPTVYPLVGNIPQMLADKENPYRLFTALAHEYGPIFKLRIGPTKWMVFVNSYEAVNEVLVTHGKQFAGRSGNYRSEVFSGKKGLICKDFSLPKVKLLRKIGLSSIKPLGSGDGNLEKLAMEMTQDFLEYFRESNGEAIDPRNQLQSTTLQMISLMVFGKKYSTDSQQFHAIKQVTDMVNWCAAEKGSGMLLDVFPWLRYFGNSVYQQMKLATELSKTFYQSVIQEVADETYDGEVADVKPLIRTMLDHNQRATDDEVHFDDEDIRVLAFQLQMAGTLTTSTSMYAFFNILLHHPKVQDELHKEINLKLGTKPVQLSDRSNLPYTCATIMELTRYTSVVPTAIPHKAVEDVQILGQYIIPKDTLVVPNLQAVHHNEDFWGDPDQFRPRRFIGDNDALIAPDNPLYRHVLAFGAGPRGCLGESFALGRLFLWIVTILQNFHLERASEDEVLVPCDPATYNPGLVLVPQTYYVRFVPKTG